jgi:hypothetical protein
VTCACKYKKKYNVTTLSKIQITNTQSLREASKSMAKKINISSSQTKRYLNDMARSLQLLGKNE